MRVSGLLAIYSKGFPTVGGELLDVFLYLVGLS